MSNFAEIDKNGLVLRVIVADQKFIDSGLVGDSASWVQTLDDDLDVRKNYPGLGYYYDRVLDAFVAPQPYLSWNLDKEKVQWFAPVLIPKTMGGGNKLAVWDESKVTWVDITTGVVVISSPMR